MTEGLRKDLASRRAVVVAEAARAAEAGTAVEMEADLVAAFERLLDDPKAKDPGCLAKTAIARALLHLEEAATARLTTNLVGRVFARGARHVQLDPVYGGRVDVAGDLRIACAAGLITCGDVTALQVLADHLADPEPSVRRAAAMNLAARADPSAVLLLRLRARLGDDDPAVHGAVLQSLLAVDEGAVDVAAGWLCGDDEARRAEAALALGASRLPGALEALRAAFEDDFDPELRKVVLAAAAMHRSDEALAFLLEVVREAAAATAADALSAMDGYAGDPTARERVEAAVGERSEPEVRRAFEGTFGPA